ncbi:MAG: PAS domain-containing protein [Deltaproteobacteria bacterium]|nr:PAS domain-containing protein [Deltaproteobacteria bacterium]
MTTAPGNAIEMGSQSGSFLGHSPAPLPQDLVGHIEAILDSQPSALVTLDAAGKVLLWNKAATKIFGVTKEQAIGNNLFTSVPGMAKYEPIFHNVLEDGNEEVRSKEAYVFPDGAAGLINILAYTLATDQTPRVIFRVRDVSQVSKLEHMAIQTEKMASVGGLASGMAHEINNPLGGILQSCQLIQMALSVDNKKSSELLAELGLPAEAVKQFLTKRKIYHYLDIIEKSGSKAASIVRNMLNFAQKKELTLKPELVDEVIDQSIKLAYMEYDLKKYYDVHHVIFEREIPQDMPQVYCDRFQIEQVLYHLIKNSVYEMYHLKQRQGDHYAPKIVFRCHHHQQRVIIEVQDNGPGMSEEIRAKVFDPFFTTKPVDKGTGLGLAMCYFILTESHQGNIRVDSTEGQGCTFIIELPAATL